MGVINNLVDILSLKKRVSKLEEGGGHALPVASDTILGGMKVPFQLFGKCSIDVDGFGNGGVKAAKLVKYEGTLFSTIDYPFSIENDSLELYCWYTPYHIISNQESMYTILQGVRLFRLKPKNEENFIDLSLIKNFMYPIHITLSSWYSDPQPEILPKSFNVLANMYDANGINGFIRCKVSMGPGGFYISFFDTYGYNENGEITSIEITF